MKFLESIKQNIAFILLFSYLVLCGVRPPTIADSIIVLGLSILATFKLYTEYRPRKDIETQLNEQKLQIYKEMSEMKASLIDQVSKVSLGVTKTQQPSAGARKVIF